MTPDQAQVVQSLAEAGAAVAAALALVAGFVQYRRSERWKRTRFVARLVREFEADVRVQRALAALDDDGRSIDLLEVGGSDPGKWCWVTDDLCEQALLAGDSSELSPELVSLRDCFDQLFRRLDRLEVFVDQGLVRAEAFRPYLTYWIEILADTNRTKKPRSLQYAIWLAIDAWYYDGVQKLCRRFGYEIQPPAYLRPGDVFFTRGRGWLSRAIRFFTRRIGESRTKVNHVGVVVEAGWMKNGRHEQEAGFTRPGEKEAVVVEALSRVRKHTLASEYLDRRTEVAVYRPRGLGSDELEKAVDWAQRQVGHPYGWFRLIGHFLDWFLLGAYVFRRLFRTKRYPICSYLVAEAFEQVRHRFFGEPPDEVSPDDVWDYVTALPNGPRFECVRELAPLPE
jgi:cell wall-associated NlpC family hydrolase